MWPSQITFGPVVLHLYGLIIGVAIWAAAQVAATVYKRQGGKEKVIWQGFLWLLVGGVIGARWYHVIDGWEYYQANPGAIFQIWQGGAGIWGGSLGGLGGGMGLSRG